MLNVPLDCLCYNEPQYIYVYTFVRMFLYRLSMLGSVMVFKTTFNNISVISWRSVLLVVETGEPGENH